MTTAALEYLKYKETERSNLANERIRSDTLQETIRHNLVGEDQQQQSIDESIRHNMSVEAETNRHNIATEGLSQQQISLGYAQLAEQNRHNLANEDIGYGQNATRYLQLGETERHNKAQEKLGKKQLEESKRSTNLSAVSKGNSLVGSAYAADKLGIADFTQSVGNIANYGTNLAPIFGKLLQ